MGLNSAELWASGSERTRAGTAELERDVFRAAVETAGAMMIVQCSTGEVLYFNKACQQISGLTAKQATGRKPWELFGLPGKAADVEAVFAGLKAGGKPTRYKYVWETGDGSRHLISWTSSAVVDESGKTRFVVSSGIDITGQEAAVGRLNRQTRELKARIRELDCLYAIARLQELSGATPGVIMKRAVETITRVWNSPEQAHVRIVLRGRAYTSPDFKQTRWKLDAPIRTSSELAGGIEICRGGPRQTSPSDSSAADERRLLEAVAERLGRIVEQLENEEQLLRYQQQLRHLASELSLAEERNRRRFAQELHDRIGQLLALAKIKLSASIGSTGDGQLAEVLELLDTATQETRAITLELSPPVLEELGFVPALDWLVTKFSHQHGTPASFSDDGLPKAPGRDLAVVLFQAVSELLHNIVKHAQASIVSVSTVSRDGWVEIEVSDDGIGFNVREVTSNSRSSDGFGLFSIRERLSHFGGRMSIRSGYRRGTRITLAAPLQPGSAVVHGLDGAMDRAADRSQIRVLLVDDHQLTRQGIRALLNGLEDIAVVEEADSGESAVELACTVSPNVVVMDVEMPGIGGIEATRRIRERLPETRVVALSMHSQQHFVLEMLRAGATGYLLKDCAQDDLVQAIRTVNSALTFFSPAIASGMTGEPAASPVEAAAAAADLSPREQEVLALMAEGLQNKAIAQHCSISVKTVESHRKHIMEKLGLHSVAQLTKYAIREGMTQLDH